MKVFITGATGFVGSHLLESLFKKGHEVQGLARSPKKWKEFQLPGDPILGDLSSDSIEEWVSLLPEDLTHVVHSAGIVHSFEEERFNKINTEATLFFFEALKKRFPSLHFVFISSLAAGGPSKPNERKKEEDPDRPVSAYGRSKLEAENLLKSTCPDSYQLTIVRPPMIIGPRDPAVLDVFKMVKGRFVLNTGFNGSQKVYSIICVFDLVNLIIKALDRTGEKTELFTPSYPIDYRFHEIIDEISHQLDIRTLRFSIPFPLISAAATLLSWVRKLFSHEVRLTPDKINELRPEAWTCSGKKSEEMLEYIYKWNLHDTVKETISDYQQRKWL